MSRYCHRLSIVLLTILLCSVSAVSRAGAVPNFDKPVSIKASDQPIEKFLQELFAQIDLPVVVAENINGRVNGQFSDKSATQVFNDVGRSFGLTIYFDGAVAYVYKANDLSQRILAVPSRVASQVIKSARGLNMIDEKNYLQSAANGGLVISGTKRFLEQIEELVAAAQSNLNEYKTPLTFRVFYLKYAWAQDVDFNFSGRKVNIPGVASIVSFLAEDGKWANFSGNYVPEYSTNTVEGLRGEGMINQGGNEGHLGIGPVTSGSQYFYGTRDTGYYNRGEVRIAVDPRLNAVIVRDSPERMAYYESLIKALDMEPQMVEIEATIIDINTAKLRELGINWRGFDDDYEALFGRGDASDTRLNPGQNITPQGEGGFLSFVLGDKDQFIGRINALEKEGAAKIVSSPQVLTLSNVEALFDTSETFYVRVAGQEEVDLFSVSVGTSLRVTPHVFSDDGSDKLKLLVTVDDGQQETQRVDDIPVVTHSVINTQALIDAGESVLIGGIVREATLNDESKIPLLGDIPVLGNLFKFKSRTNERVERMFLITPRLSIRRLDTKDIPVLESITEQKKDIASYFELRKHRVPEYPSAALDEGIEGYCVVDYGITKSGKTVDIKAGDCSNPLFASAAKNAVKKFKFDPKLSSENMIAIPSTSTRFNFELEPGR